MLKGIIPLNFNEITQSVNKTDAVLTLKHERVPLESSQTL